MKLLVVTDLGETAAAFLHSARTWATRFADWVWIVHVEDPEPAFVGYDAGPQGVRDSVAHDIRAHHRRLEIEAERWRGSGLDTTALVIQGPVLETILDEAARVQADVIVMGAPTHGRWHDLLLGDVANSLIRLATCPVLVIPHVSIPETGEPQPDAGESD